MKILSKLRLLAASQGKTYEYYVKKINRILGKEIIAKPQNLYDAFIKNANALYTASNRAYTVYCIAPEYALTEKDKQFAEQLMDEFDGQECFVLGELQGAKATARKRRVNKGNFNYYKFSADSGELPVKKVGNKFVIKNGFSIEHSFKDVFNSMSQIECSEIADKYNEYTVGPYKYAQGMLLSNHANNQNILELFKKHNNAIPYSDEPECYNIKTVFKLDRKYDRTGKAKALLDQLEREGLLGGYTMGIVWANSQAELDRKKVDNKFYELNLESMAIFGSRDRYVTRWIYPTYDDVILNLGAQDRENLIYSINEGLITDFVRKYNLE